MTKRRSPRTNLLNRFGQSGRPLFLLAVLAMLCVWPRAGQAGELVSYVATYGLTLEKLRNGDKADRSGGQLVTKFERICEGWRVSSQMIFAAGMGGGSMLKLRVENGVEEASDGTLISFASANFLNDDPPIRTKGAAQRFPDGTGRAIFTAPKRQELKLPKGVRFPVSASRELLRRLEAGHGRRERILFDGFAPGAVRAVENVTGRHLKLSRKPTGDIDLLEGRQWHIESDWTLWGGDEIIQRTSMQLHENGIASRMVIDLGLMVINAKLTDIRRLAAPQCKGGKN